MTTNHSAAHSAFLRVLARTNGAWAVLGLAGAIVAFGVFLAVAVGATTQALAANPFEPAIPVITVAAGLALVAPLVGLPLLLLAR